MRFNPVQKTPNKTQGFTVIEVLIVLAIAGLVLTIVFLAVPAMQRNFRNTARKKDVATTLAFIQQTIVEHNNELPGSCNTSQLDCFLRDHSLLYYQNKTDENIVSLHNRSTLGPYNDPIDLQLDPNDPLSSERISIRTWANCNGGLLSGENATPRDIAAQFVIETGSGGARQCVEL